MSVGIVAAVGSAVVGGISSNNASKKAAEANQKAIDANAYQGKIATDQYEDYKTTYRPLEQSLVKDAQNYDTPAAYEKAAGEAQSTVSEQLGMARDRLSRTPGLDPSSAAAQAAMTDLDLKGAAIGATAQNAARTSVKDKAYARKLDAVGLGKGLIAGATTGLASATSNANALAANQARQASDTASGTGALVAGIGNAIGKADWSGVGGLFGGNNHTVAPITANQLPAPQGMIKPSDLNITLPSIGG